MALSAAYDRHAVPPEEVRTFSRALRDLGYLGCNVTLPHKEAVFDVVNIADDATRRLGVVNTVFSRNGELWGISTDGEGFLANSSGHRRIGKYRVETS